VKKAFVSWSGGKDSALALYRALRDETLSVNTLVTTVNSFYDRVSMHGVRKELLRQQAAEIDMELELVYVPEQPSMDQYESVYTRKLSHLKAHGFCTGIFGDIFLEDLKTYREGQLAVCDLKGSFPLWKEQSKDLLYEFLNEGFKAIVVCVNSRYLGPEFCGRIIDEQFIKDLPEGVDICGENGEFHTFVFDGPIFTKPVEFIKGDITERRYIAPKKKEYNCYKDDQEEQELFYFCELLPA
jgi:uncharacterized protein (TIGR00290 family)